MKDIKELVVYCKDTDEVKKTLLIFNSYGFTLGNGTLDFYEKTLYHFVGYYVPDRRIYLDHKLNTELKQTVINFEDFVKQY